MKQRIVKIERNTKETQIETVLNLDGSGDYIIKTPIGFLNHMLELFAKHGLFDIEIKAKGDTYIDEHHTVEDIGITLGQAFVKAVGDKKGINRYGFFILPMEETLATVAVDFCGRFTYLFDCKFNRRKIGDLSTELIYDFWDAFAQNAKINLQIKVDNGRNTHHKIEAIFKAVAKAVRMATELDSRLQNKLPSTKGVL